MLSRINSEVDHKMMREKYIKKFGEKQAQRIEEAATTHYLSGATVSGKNKGSNPFKWAILTIIDFQCVEKYAKEHGITVSNNKFMKFCVKHRKELGEHDGDIGWIGVVAGVFDFINKK